MTKLATDDCVSTSNAPVPRFSVGHRFIVGHRGLAIAGWMVLVIGLGLTIARTIKQYQPPGPYIPARQGLCDFHNGVYFPALAVMHGRSPYGETYANEYPVARQIPFFSPSILVLHSPLVLLPMRVAEIAYYLLSIGAILAIAILVASQLGTPIRWDVALWIAVAIAYSRGGHITLFNGYFTLELVLATLVAIHYGDRKPWIAALALVVVSAKPTYILPLGLLMLARGNFKAIAVGAVLSIVAAILPMTWMAYHEGGGDIAAGLQIIRQDIGNAQHLHLSQIDESPLYSWTRIDLLAIVAKWTGDDPQELTHLVVMGLILAPVMWILFQIRKRDLDDGLLGITGALILATMLASLYHQSYDAVLLIAPLVGATMAGRWRKSSSSDASLEHASPASQYLANHWKPSRKLSHWETMPTVPRLGLMFLLAIPLYNYLTTRMVLSRLFPTPEETGTTAGVWARDSLQQGEAATKLLTSLNGVSLALLIFILMALFLRQFLFASNEHVSHPNPPSKPDDST